MRRNIQSTTKKQTRGYVLLQNEMRTSYRFGKPSILTDSSTGIAARE